MLAIVTLMAVVAAGSAAATDLEVVCIERSPKYHSYHGHVRYHIGKTYTDDFTPYAVDVAYGLEGQDEDTRRWPENGEPVTFTAHILNRSDHGVEGFDYEWRLDGEIVDSGRSNETVVAGGMTTLRQKWRWDAGRHRILCRVDHPDDRHAGNDFIEDYTDALGLFTFIDRGYAKDFERKTAKVGYPSTDSVTEWLQRHRRWMNRMLEEAGCEMRWRYDRLQFIEDDAELFEYDRTQWDGNFPTRFRRGDDDLRLHAGYYDPEDDIDYGLLHEIAHQLGVIDLYRLDVSPEQNRVTGMGRSAREGLMKSCAHFISEHTALAMNSWRGKRRGYFGQFLFDVPRVNRLRVLAHDGEPLEGAQVTVYQKIETRGEGEHIPDKVKFVGTTDADGLYTFPNVEVDASDFWCAVGDELRPNPFGYISNHGENGVFYIKIEKAGAADYVWLDITEFNIAYWSGDREEATYTRNTALGGPVQERPPTELTEQNAANWTCWAEGASGEIADDGKLKIAGDASIRFETGGGFDTYIRYPAGIVAHWDLRSMKGIRVSFRAENENRFQNNSPWIRLGNYGGSYIELHATGELLDGARDRWINCEIPIEGGDSWERTSHGEPDLSDVNYIEIHADTWAFGFTLWVDGLTFVR